MMLRLIILVLTLANLGFYGWSEGWFDAFARPRSTGDREPQRLALQSNPELMKLSGASATFSGGVTGAVNTAPAPVVSTSPAVSSATARTGSISQTAAGVSAAASVAAAASSGASASTASPAPAPPPGPTLSCIESGPYLGKEASTAEAALKALPAGSWTAVPNEKAGVWMLFMGRFADDETRRRKEGELNRRKAPYEEVDAPPDFARGLSLGRFSSRADADKGSAELNRLGVHTARIVVFTPPVVTRSFRLEKADVATADKAKSLGLPMPFVSCAAAAAAEDAARSASAAAPSTAVSSPAR